jgi:hypothetical protein
LLETSGLSPAGGLILLPTAYKKLKTYSRRTRPLSSEALQPDSSSSSDNASTCAKQPMGIQPSTDHTTEAAQSYSTAASGLPLSSDLEPSGSYEKTSISNLSQVFGLIPRTQIKQSSRTSSTKKTAIPSSEADRISKRMLSRASTEISLPSTPSKDERQTCSLPSLPNTPSFSQIPPPIEDLTASPSTVPNRPSVRSIARTYSGKSRSFLLSVSSSHYGVVSGETADGPPGAQDSGLTEDAEQRESYTALRTRFGVDRSDDDSYHPSPSVSEEEEANENLSPIKPSESVTTNDTVVPVRLPEGMMNDLRSTIELRSKGESQKFLDDVGYLFEGLDAGSSDGSKRSSALEIVKRLCDPEFFRKAVATDFCGQTIDMLYEAGIAAGTDHILNCIFSIFLWLLSRDATALLDLVLRPLPNHIHYEHPFSLPSCLVHLCLHESLERDVLYLVSTSPKGVFKPDRLAQAALRRGDKPILNDIQNVMYSISVNFPSPEISSCFLITNVLTCIPPAHMTTSLGPNIVSMLQNYVTIFSPSLEAFKKGSYPFSPNGHPSFTLEQGLLTLKLLDAYFLGEWTDDNNDEAAIPLHLVNTLLDICLFSELNIKANSSAERAAAKCWTFSLRLLLNLTYDSEENPYRMQILETTDGLLLLIRRFLQSYTAISPLRREVKPKLKEEESFWLAITSGIIRDESLNCDHLCLTLGLFINLAQGSTKARLYALLDVLDMNPSCPLQFQCFPICTCANETKQTALKLLLNVYRESDRCSDLQTSSFSIESSSTSDEFTLFIHGHLIILLVQLMQADIHAQKCILQLLPGSNNASKVACLIDYCRIFEHFFTFCLENFDCSKTSDVSWVATYLPSLNCFSSRKPSVINHTIVFLQSLDLI